MSKMKDSGIKWIGEIPEHWKVLRHKDLMRKEKSFNYQIQYDSAFTLLECFSP